MYYISMIMANFDYYLTNINKQSEIIKGLCNQMCPPEEIAMREREKLVHVLEVMEGERRLVKSYSRSAADANMAKPKLLRPYNTLRDTIEYLLLEVTKRSDVPMKVVYDFVTDRLRAVRQDMTIQRLSPQQNIDLLDPMIRFHVFYGYKLCELPIKEYDPVLNKKYLLECLKWFLSCTDIIYQSQTEKVDELSEIMSSLNVKRTNKLTCDRVLMESLYIICNLDDVHPLLRYLNLAKWLTSDPTLHTAYKIAIANMKGNFIEMCRLLEHLCPLTYCAFCLYLPVLQRQALQALSHGYNNKQLTVPLCVIRQWLVFSSDTEVSEVCQYYGLTVKGDSVLFSKTDYKDSVSTMQPKKPYGYEKRLNLSLDYIFTYILRS